MNHFQPTRIALLFAALGLASCDNDRDPIQPEVSPGETTAPPEFAVASNSWTARAGIPGGRSNMGAGVVKNSAGQPIVYLLGGYGPGGAGGKPTTKVQAYNYSTDTWATKQALGGSLYPNGVGVIGGKLYLSGGYAGTTMLATLVAYDPARDVFTTKASMPIRAANGVSGVIGGKLYVLPGEYPGNASSRRFFRYNPATNSWASLPSAPNYHRSGAAGVIGGKFYVAGGFDPNGNYTNKLDVYDPATNKWKSLMPLPAPQAEAGGAVLQNRLFVIGGSACCTGGKAVYAYDPATNQWQSKAPLQRMRYGLGAASLISLNGNPRILALGGIGHEGWPTDANEVYTP